MLLFLILQTKAVTSSGDNFSSYSKQEDDKFRILAVMVEQISVERTVLWTHFQNEIAFHLEKQKKKRKKLEFKRGGKIKNREQDVPALLSNTWLYLQK